MVKVVRAQVYDVEPACFNTVRSFLESSEKEQYIWNTGVIIYKLVVFKKPGKWTLVIYPEDGITVLKGKKGIALSIEHDIPPRIKAEVCGMQFKVKDIIELLPVYFTSDVDYVEPISLYSILEKALKYRDAAMAEYYKPVEAEAST